MGLTLHLDQVAEFSFPEINIVSIGDIDLPQLTKVTDGHWYNNADLYMFSA